MSVPRSRLYVPPPEPAKPGVVKPAAVIASTGMLADLATESWVFWIVWAALGLAFELFAVYTEKEKGTLPLTRVARDRLMRKSTIAKYGMLTFLTWLWIHFIFPLSW